MSETKTLSKNIRIDSTLLSGIDKAIKKSPEYSDNREFLESAGYEKLGRMGVKLIV